MDDDTDDQSSGWFEVKKKHRRFSIQGLVGGFSNKIPSQSSVYSRSANSQSKQKFHVSKAAESFATRIKPDSGNSLTVLKEGEKVVPCLDKCIVTEHIEPPSSDLAEVTSITGSNDKPQNVQVAVQNEKSDVPRIPKIKWGDLEDDALLVCHENLDETETRIHDFGDDRLLTCRKSEVPGESEFSDSCCTVPQEDKTVVTFAETQHPSAKIPSSIQRDIPYKEVCKDIRESRPTDTMLSEENDEMLRSDRPCFEEVTHTHVKLVDGEASDELNSSNQDNDYSLSLPLEEVEMLIASQGNHDKPEDVSVTISSIPVDQSVVSIAVDNQDNLPPVRGSVPELSGDVSMQPLKDWNGSQDSILNIDKTKTESTDITEEGESSESKERFRERLWCFLFENLNRSLDELYLLCELECDLEQLKEAILVLEEAGSDFKELKSRVEEFEIVKKPSQSLDGLPVYGKTDHRRAHALSWEVRRMAASPHRAEILSSSLEAFKKIQKERIGIRTLRDTRSLNSTCAGNHLSAEGQGKIVERNGETENVKETVMHSKKQTGIPDVGRGHAKGGKKNMEGRRSSKALVGPQGSFPPPTSSTPDPNTSHVSSRGGPCVPVAAKNKRDPHGSASEPENQVTKKDKILIDSKNERNPKYMDPLKRHLLLLEKEKEREKEKEKEKEKDKRDSASWRSLDAWKKKRNWEDILTSPLRSSSRVSHSPGMSRKNMERTRVLHDKLMSPEKKKKTASDLKKEAEEKHARATRIRSELENERLQRLQRTSEKLIRVNEWQAVRTVKLKEGMHARHQRSESRHEAYLAQVVRRAGDESSKVNEVRFITSLNEENKKYILRQKLHDSKLRRDEKLHIIKTKQKEDNAREEAVSERRRLLQAEKLQRLAEIQRKKEEAQIRREEERKASSAAREARAMEQLRRKEIRAKVQQEEAELLAQKLAERLSESEQRRKIYLEQIRERASMDFRDQSSPLMRRSSNKDSLARSTSASNVEDYYATNTSNLGGSFLGIGDTALQHSLKRKIKKIRQKLMALKHEFNEPSFGAENAGSGYSSLIGSARAKIGRWIQDLQRFRQARKEGASSIGLIVIDIIKFLEGKEPELHASRQAGLLDFLASALPASHTSKPEACHVTTYLLRLLKVVLSMPENRSYFLSHNLLPPVIPMLSAALENYIKIAASMNVPGNTNSLSGKTSVENFDSVSEVLEGFIWIVTTIMGHICSDERQVQMKDFLLELLISYQVIHRLRELFALHDRPQVEGSPFPLPIILSLNLLVVLTSRPETVSSIDWGSFPSKVSIENQDFKNVKSVDIGDSCTNVTERPPLSESCYTREVPQSDAAEDGSFNDCTIRRRESSSSNGKFQNMKQPVAFLLSVIAETGLVSLPSLLTAVLLQANNRLSSEQGSYVLPSNFEEVATGVLKVLNNLALLDITLMQRMLARPDLKMEFFHLMSFLLSHCSSKWKSATDQVGMLLLESLLLLGYFALFHSGNQAVLRWGKSPTILHKVCDLPFVFFSDSELMPILAGTLVSACYGCEQNRGVVQQELSTEMLLSLVGSCRNASLSNPFPLDNTTAIDSCEGSQSCIEPKKFQVEIPVKSSRNNPKNNRLSLGKGGASGSSTRVTKVKNSRDVKTTKTCEQWALKHNLPTSETSSTFMLHSRFPTSFIDKAEEFFSSSVSNLLEES